MRVFAFGDHSMFESVLVARCSDTPTTWTLRVVSPTHPPIVTPSYATAQARSGDYFPVLAGDVIRAHDGPETIANPPSGCERTS